MSKSVADRIAFKLYDPFSQFDSVKETWISMLRKCPHTYFLSWAWIETWITSLPRDCKLSLVAGIIDESPVIAFFVGFKTITRYKIIKVRQLSLNSTLNKDIDTATYIEYNKILIDPEITISLESLLELMPIKSWDEFYMPRCISTNQPNLVLNNNLEKKYSVSIITLKAYYVSLEKVRHNDNDYLALLSHKRRQRIRRSLREYERMGDLQVFIAENTEDALNIFDEMVQLHQQSWQKRGHRGAFYSEYSVDFHNNLISRRFEHGEIQLIKISAGTYTIGCRYLYIYNGMALGIAGGLNYLPGKVYIPGFITHYFAIMHNAMMGLRSYDFLEGEHEYKRSLATDEYEMYDILVKRKSMKPKILKIIDKLVHFCRRRKN